MSEMASKRARKAPVWTYMDQISPDTIVCLVCKDKLKYNRNTSSMIKHLRTRHPLEYVEMREESEPDTAASQRSAAAATSSVTVQPTLVETIDRSQSYKKDSAKKKELDRLLMIMIAQDLRPLCITESKGFKRFVRGLNPRYELPSRRELTRTLLPSLYDEEVCKVQEEVEKADYIALTTDIWTSRQTKGYITVTAHFISPDFECKSFVLETVRMTKNHTAQNIAEELTHACNKWKIMDKIYCVVTDSAANMCSAVKNIMSLRHLPCFAHTLNLVVQDSLKNVEEMQAVKDKVKQIVGFFHHSVKASDKLSQLQQQHDVPVKKLIQEVETRWNSTYYMLERFIQESDLVTTTLCLLGRNDLCLNSDELGLIKKAVSILEYFDEATKELSSENFTSLSKVIPIIRGLQDSLQCTDMDVHTLKDFSLCEELRKQMNRRFSAVEGVFIMGAATILDPRFKKLPFSNASNSKAVEERLLSILRSMYSASQSESTTATEVVEASTSGLTTNKEKKICGKLLMRLQRRPLM